MDAQPETRPLADAGPVTVRLQPCGKARARLVDRAGQPVAHYQVNFSIVGTPGPPRFSRAPEDVAALGADEEFMANVDRLHYWNLRQTDEAGRIEFPALIPGALYRLADTSRIGTEQVGVQVRCDFTVEPGATVDLGDLLIDSPRAR